MVQDRDNKYEVQDDSEYHFSDDQMNYEVDSGDAAVKPVVTGGSFRSRLTDTMAQNRKALLGILIFLILIMIVYFVLSPSASAPVTEFAADNPNKTITSQTTTVNTTPVLLPQTAAPAPLTAAPAPTPTTAPLSPTPAVTPADIVSTSPVIVAPPTQPVIQAPATASPVGDAQQPTVVVTASPATAAESYMPHTAEVDNEINAMQGKLQDMNMRLTNMEATLTKLSQMIQDLKMPRSSDMVVKVRPPRPFVPKVAYTVQAIIPGRAWLKSENGETVTVTQGDILRGYGKIVKIDPYDGNVKVDVGDRTITLTYGAGVE